MGGGGRWIAPQASTFKELQASELFCFQPKPMQGGFYLRNDNRSWPLTSIQAHMWHTLMHATPHTHAKIKVYKEIDTQHLMAQVSTNLAP